MTIGVPYRTPFRRYANSSVAASLGTAPLWLETEAEPVYRPLTMHVTCETCIIGAGIAGLTVAYLLAKAGQRVVVIDSGSGETRRTTGHLTTALDGGIGALEQSHGGKHARQAAQSHRFAIDLVERIVRDEQMSCEFERVDGYLMAATPADTARLVFELAAAQRAGLLDVGEDSRASFATNHRARLRFSNQAQLHPLKYMKGLVDAIESQGGRLFRARAIDLHPSGQRAVRTTNGLRIDCRRTIIAANCSMDDRRSVHARLLAHRGYVIGIQVPAGMLPHALLWDTADPYHYARVASSPAAGKEVLLVGGEDHRTGSFDDGIRRFAKLETWAHEHFTGLGQVHWRWSGQVIDPIDGLGYAGLNPGNDERTWLIAGGGGNGLTHGTLGAHLVAEKILGRDVEWSELYSPCRKQVKSATRMARERLHAAAQFGAHFTPGDVASRDEIAPGSGAVIREGPVKLAVYRDALGALHERSAHCTHLGCVVHWNDTEQSWDCPCHGSRFAVDGSVLNGPALTPLGITTQPAVPEPVRATVGRAFLPELRGHAV